VGLRTYLLKRLVHAVFVMFFVVTVVFAAVRSIPGDPARLMLGGDVDTETLNALRAELGLDAPLYVQYLRWLGRLLSGDLGESIRTGEPVLASLAQVAGPTLSIAGLGMVIALVIAVPTGIISAVKRYEIEDYLSTTVGFFGISMPAFWIGIVLILLVGVNVPAIPTFGYTPIDEGVVAWLSSILLPAFAVGFPYGGILMRMMRSSMLEVLNEDYIRTAQAKGLPTNLVLFKHGLQNALIPVVTLAGIFLAVVLGGVVAVEIVFGIRGLGRLLIGSINRRDFPMIQGTVLVIAFVFVLANIVVDLLYTMINPRIKYGGGD
jgi:peptide/nickel transport system permease protein